MSWTTRLVRNEQNFGGNICLLSGNWNYSHVFSQLHPVEITGIIVLRSGNQMPTRMNLADYSNYVTMVMVCSVCLVIILIAVYALRFLV